MKLTEGDVNDLVQECHSERADYYAAAEAWENIWRMEPYDESSPRASGELDGVARVKLADGYNIVQLATRFIADDIRIEIPYISATDDDDARSTLMEEWSSSFWARASRQQGINLLSGMSWYSLVRGRGAIQVLWVEDVLPKKLQGKRLPILPRLLDPMNVGSRQGPYYTDYAYHEYDAKPTYVKQLYPDYKIDDRESNGYYRKKTCKMIDLWYRDGTGCVWHCVTVDKKFAKPPVKTDYPEVPIIEWSGDSAPIQDFLYQGMSILHPLKDLYKTKCDLASGIATALRYYFYPIITARGVHEDIDIGPGATIMLPQADSQVDVLRLDPNMNLANTMVQMVDTQIQQATFPAVLYGEGGSGASGYAINQLGSAARGRVNTIRSNQESACERVNELAYQLVEIMGGDEGVTIWGSSAYENRGRPLTLRAKDIKETYANEVKLIPEVPSDDTQRIATWINLVNAGVVSKMTVRDRIINIPTPRDEDLRIAVEQVMQTPEMQQKHALRALQKWIKSRDDWELLIAGTPLDQVYQQEQQLQLQRKQEKEQAKAARKQERDMKEAMKNLSPEQLAMMQAMGGPGPMPPGMPPGPEGMPPDMGMMPQGGMPGAMPSGLPPGGESLGMPGMGGPMPPQGLPPGMGPVPPEAGAGLTPEQLGIPPQGGPPGLYQQLQGKPLTPEEILRRMAEQGGGGPTPPGV